MKHYLAFLVIVVSICMIYFIVPSFAFQWNWDDNWMVINQYTSMGFSWQNIWNIFTTFYIAQYSPLNELMYMAIHSLFGYNPHAYHICLIVLHIINSCLILLLLERLIQGMLPTDTARWVAFATALLFAIHPMQVESIAWIAGSKIPLYTLFILLALLSYIHFVRTQKKRFYIWAFLLFVCAFGSKEQCIVLPATLLLIDWVLGRTPLQSGNRQADELAIKPWNSLLAEKLPFIVFALFGGLLTYFNQDQGVIESWAGYPLGQRLVFCCYSIVGYLSKLAAPVGLYYLYTFPMSPGEAMPVKYFVYPVILIGALCLLIYWLRKQNMQKHWPIIFGIFFFLINLSLMLHIIAMSRFTVMADRYVYLASVGLFFIAAWYGVQWLQMKAKSGRKWAFAIVTVYLVYLGGYAHLKTYSWRDGESLRKELMEMLSPKDLETMQNKDTGQDRTIKTESDQ